MKIVIEKNRVIIGQNVDHVKNVSYAYTPSKESVTFFINDNYKTLQVDDITVNEVQMTVDNIDDLLVDLFKDECSCGSGSKEQSDWLVDNVSDVSFIRNRPYTKQVYTETLVFPKAVCTGHTLDIIKDGELYQTYQWNGWLWEQIGVEPNFIFKGIHNEVPERLAVFPSFKQSNDTYYLKVERDGSYNVSLTISSILKSTIPFSLRSLYVALDDNDVDEKHLIANIQPGMYFDLSYLNENQYLQKYKCKDIFLDNILSYLDFHVNTTSSDVYVENSTMGIGDTGGIPSIKAHSATILNTSILFCNISLYPLENENGIIDVKLTNCSFTTTPYYKKSGVAISFEPIAISDGSYKAIERANIVYKNNTEGSLEVKGTTAVPTIESVDLDASKLTKASFDNLAFSDTAFASLISALTSVRVNSISLNYTNCIPTLTDNQKVQLSAAGWKLQ